MPPLLSEYLRLWEEQFKDGGDLPAREICADRPELAEEVQRAIDAIKRARQQPPSSQRMTPDDRTAPPSEGALAATAAGDSPPGYELLGELGRGGMGIVYRARQVALNRAVALKMILAASHASADQQARFRREAEAVARLNHPHIVQVYEVGGHNGRPFFSLEVCEGGSLDKRLAGTPIAPGESAVLVTTLADAMQAAHQANVLHRDLKPGNVLLTTDGTPKITDFGLAKMLDEPGQTLSNAVMGTPSYMSPEQALGEKEVGPLADVYSLGAILYECLTGRPPFKAATTYETLLQVVGSEPVPPRQLNAQVPRDLETVCLKCLSKEPGRRYASARELADDLRRWQAGEPVRARPVSRLARGWKWARRNPAVAGLTAAVATVLCAGVVVSALFALHAGAEARRADREAQEALRLASTESQARHAAELQAYRADSATHALLLEGALQALAGNLELEHASENPGRGGVSASERAAELLRGAPASMRDTWEHRYVLATQSRLRPLSIKAHSSRVGSVAIGRGRIVSRSEDKTVKVWDAQTGKLQRTISADQLGALAITPDGGRIATGGEDGTIKVCDAETGQEKVTLKGHTGVVYCLAFSTDGKRLVSGGGTDHKPGELKVWDAATGQGVLSLQGHKRPVTMLSVSADRKRIVATSRLEPEVKLWDAETGEEKRNVGASGYATISPDGRFVAIPSGAGVSVSWADGGQRATLGHDRALRWVTWSPDGKHIVSVSEDGTASVWDAETWERKQSAKLLGGNWESFAISPDGKYIVLGASDGMVRKVWITGVGLDTLTLAGHVDTVQVRSVSISADGKRVLSLQEGSIIPVEGVRVRVWDGEDGQLKHSIQPRLRFATSAAISPDGKRFACWSEEDGDGGHSQLVVSDTETGKQMLTIRGQRETSGMLSPVVRFYPDGNSILAVGRQMKVRDALTGQEKLTLPPLVPPDGLQVLARAITPDNRRIAYGGTWARKPGSGKDAGVPAGFIPPLAAFLAMKLDELRVWEVETGRECFSLRLTSPQIIKHLAISADGKRLVSASEKTMKAWDAVTAENLLTLNGHTAEVMCFVFSPDGKRIASGSWDRTIKVWDARTGQEKVTLKGHRGIVTSLAWSGDGRRLASSSEDGTVRLWGAPPAAK